MDIPEPIFFLYLSVIKQFGSLMNQHIKKLCLNMMIQNHSLEIFGFEYVEYYDIVRKLIEEYRLLFIDWVAGFDR